MGSRRSTILASRIVVAVALVCAAAAMAGARKAKTFAGWHEGAEGYRAALAEQEATGKPLLVYFHAPWCHFCADVNKKVMTDPAVAEEVGGMIGVRIYGEDGAEERALMAKFGAEAYPRLFLRPDAGAEFRRVEVFDGVGQIVPASRFLQALHEAAGSSAAR